MTTDNAAALPIESVSREKKIEWMAMWCARNTVALQLEGECGFGRECVGILAGDAYPDYHWYDQSTYEQVDDNGDVWTPDDAYHKSQCVAVLGRGERAEAQLYEWLQWFDREGFTTETGTQPVDPKLGAIAYVLGKHLYARMVKATGQ